MTAVYLTRADGSQLTLDRSEALDMLRQLREQIAGPLVGAQVSFGPSHARHRMLVLGDRTHCTLRATQLEGGTVRMVAIADGEPEASRPAPL